MRTVRGHLAALRTACRDDSGVRRPGAPGRGARRGGRKGGRGTGRDRGTTAIEFVVLTPIIFLMIFATVQFALYYFADHVALAAAQAGARKGRDQADADPTGWYGQARTTARSYVRQLGPSLMSKPRYAPLGDGVNTAGIEVRANVVTVFPGLKFTVDEKVQGPVEKFVPDNGG
jgi:Flp pilus assembly protein TadG